MNRINKNIKFVITHPSFWKIILLICVCFVVLKHFIHKSEDTAQKQSLVPIVIELPVSLYTPLLRLSGFTKPMDHGILKANYKAVVEKVLIQRGRHVKKGDIVLTLSSPEIEKRLTEAISRYKQKLAEYESAKKLTQKAFKAENTYLAVEADLEQAIANLRKAETDANELKVTASEDGYLEECYVHVGDTVFAQDKLVQIVYPNVAQVRLYASEDSISMLNIGMKAHVKVANEEYLGEIAGISKFADPNTRNFYIDLNVLTKEKPFPFGATAEVIILLPEQKGFWINASALTLNDKGELGIKILKNDKVLFVAVELSSLTENGAYIKYNADSLSLIAYGGEFLLPGQTPVVHWQKLPIL